VRILARLALAVCGLAPWAAAQEKPPDKVEPSTSAPAGKVLEWTSAEGKPYWYKIPKNLDKAKPPALVVMFHGTGCKYFWPFANYPIADGQFRKNDIIVGPEGMTPGGGDTFNFTQCKADADHVAGIIAWFKKRLPVGKVYLYGHSQGAFFTYWFAGERPDLVDGIVAHAGNVLANVKHPQAAKEKVAIGILHGRADAVVPVDCAYATEKVYKDLGYKKVKLMVVEGLNEQTGHWPLPVQAGEMFAWLDQVSADSLRASVEVALHEIARGQPDLEPLAAAASAGARLLKTAKADEKTAFSEKQAAIEGLVADLAARHSAALAQRPDSRKPDSPHGAWAAHFRVANRGLDAAPAWQTSMKELRQRAATHEKAVGSALAKLEKSGGPALGEVLKALETGFLASSYDDLLGRAVRLADGSPKGAVKQDVVKLKQLADARRSDTAAGYQAAAAVTIEAAGAFRKEHASWFE
jgi:pimeloyl-ACP methyl ester carboxylesterase